MEATTKQLFWLEVLVLAKKEALLEWRQRYAINGIFLYLGSTIFVCYLSFQVSSGTINSATWNTIFWIIILFSAVSASAKSFMQEPAGRLVYLYTICSPQGLIIAKSFYNFVLLLVLSLLGYFFYGVVMGNPVKGVQLYLFVIVLAAMGFSASLTLISGIAAKAGNNTTLMTILSFPVLIPMLLMIIKISSNAIKGYTIGGQLEPLSTLLALNVIIIAVSYILFPYLWRS